MAADDNLLADSVQQTRYAKRLLWAIDSGAETLDMSFAKAEKHYDNFRKSNPVKKTPAQIAAALARKADNELLVSNTKITNGIAEQNKRAIGNGKPPVVDPLAPVDKPIPVYEKDGSVSTGGVEPSVEPVAKNENITQDITLATIFGDAVVEPATTTKRRKRETLMVDETTLGGQGLFIQVERKTQQEMLTVLDELHAFLNNSVEARETFEHLETLISTMGNPPTTD